MSALTIRDVPDDTLKVLKVRAAQAGKSLQSYVLQLVTTAASRPALSELSARLERETHTELSTTDILDVIEDGRNRR